MFSVQSLWTFQAVPWNACIALLPATSSGVIDIVKPSQLTLLLVSHSVPARAFINTGAEVLYCSIYVSFGSYSVSNLNVCATDPDPVLTVT